MKTFDLDFENIDTEDSEKYSKSMNIKQRIIDSLSWHSADIKKIHVECEDEKGQKYKKMIIEW